MSDLSFDKGIPCVVELFGYQRIAGIVSSQTIGGGAFVRVDVPAVEGQAAFTKLYGDKAIYAITPCDEATMLLAVNSFRAVPIERYHLNIPTRAALPVPDDDDIIFDDDGNNSRF